jgi:hypothetical protein
MKPLPVVDWSGRWREIFAVSTLLRRSKGKMGGFARVSLEFFSTISTP